MSVMLGQKAPVFSGTALNGGDAAKFTPDNAFKDISLEDYKGKWVIFFFYPLDFTFVCPTELVEFGKAYEEFKSMDTEVVACSTDSQFSHLAWRQNDKTLQNLPYPILADFTGKVASDYGVLKEETGYALRGLYIIDPEGVLKYYVVHNEDVGRNTAEIKRVLSALQTGGLTPCNWEDGQDTLG